MKTQKIWKWGVAALMALALPGTLDAQPGATDTVSAGDEDVRHNFNVAKHLEIFNDLYTNLDLYYVDSLDAKKNIGNAIAYMLSQLDPYTAYYDEDNKEELDIMTSGKYAGMGAAIGYRKSERRCIIDEPYEGKPAALAGLRHGDVLLAKDGVDYGTAEEGKQREYMNKVTASLRGEPGTSMTLTVKRQGVKKPLDIVVTRQLIVMPNVALSKLYADSVGYILLSGFNEHAAEEMRTALDDLRRQGARRLILDLRGNPGGLLDQANDIVNLFLPKGKMVAEIKGKQAYSASSYITKNEPVDTLMPLVVLVGESSASAAEVTAGALQDYDRAVILGMRTYGKGLVQQVHELAYDTEVKITTSKYYIPSGRCLQAYTYKEGVPQHVPDSLAKVFHTAAGRTVYDGGGITPDITIVPDSLPSFLDDIDNSEAVSDFCVQYVNKHPEMKCADDVHLTDADYEDFKAFMKEHKADYDTRSKQILKILKNATEAEGYKAITQSEIAALEQKLSGSTDYDLEQWKDEIKYDLERGIATIVAYQRGSVEIFLRSDKIFKQALSIVRDDARCREILRGEKK